MPKAARSRATPLHASLPDDISIWEILVRLPPEALLRCRSVCRAWHRITSNRDFLLAHHARQPTLPILWGNNRVGANRYCVDIIPFDHRATADHRQSVTRLGNDFYHLEASYDGLLILSIKRREFFICNPATREWARLPMLSGFTMLGMYRHSPTGEYQLLLYSTSRLSYDDGSYIFTLGYDQPPRHIRGLDAKKLIMWAPGPVLFRGSLHWNPMNDGSGSKMIRVFNTTAESFREMHTPVVFRGNDLFEMNGMLAMSSFNSFDVVATTIDIWITQDYESEVWALKYRVELLFADLNVEFGKFTEYWNVVAASWDGEVLLLAKFEDRLLKVNIDGKLVVSFHCRGLGFSQFRLKQTLVSHTFFPKLEGYVVNTLPFI